MSALIESTTYNKDFLCVPRVFAYFFKSILTLIVKRLNIIPIKHSKTFNNVFALQIFKQNNNFSSTVYIYILLYRARTKIRKCYI